MKTKRNINLLIAGRTVSLFGTGIYQITLPLYILQISGSLLDMGMCFALVKLPALLVSPFLGTIVDRINRKWSLILCDMISSFCFFLLLMIYSTTNLTLPIILIISIFLYIIDSFFSITSSVIFTELNDESTMEPMNALKSFFDNLSSVCAPMLGTLLFGWFGLGIILLVNALSYVTSAVQEYFISYQNQQLKEVKEYHPLIEMKEGMFYILKHPMIRSLFLLIMSLNFFISGSDEIIWPGILKLIYHIPDTWYGIAVSLFVFGSMIASFFIYHFKNLSIYKHLSLLFILNSTVMVIAGIASLVMREYPFYFFLVFIVLQFINGVLISCINIPLISSFQTNVTLDMQGRFFSILSFCSGLLIPAGIWCIGFIADLLGADIAYMLANGCIILIVLSLKDSIKKNMSSLKGAS